ncbi:MAG: 16S rRNA processing protein RimM [Desulfocapsa sp.]|nr:16S rRNA processing protein RimM [Desulfocapsa sp.]
MADSFPYDAKKYVLIGKVTKAHGIKGELKIRAYSDDLHSVTRHKELLLVSEQGKVSPAFNVSRSRIGNKEVIVSFKEVTDRNYSEELCGMGVLVYKKALPDLKADEFYLYELEGLQVQTEAGEIIGKVNAFFNNGVQDLIVVNSGKNEVLIPLIPGMITERNKSCITIAPPPGLIDINSGGDASDI